MISQNFEDKKNNYKELKKHVSIIHCSNSLSLLQRKISNVLLFHAYPFLQIQEEHKISIRELCSYLDYHGRNYDVIKQALKVLISTVVEWNLIEDKIEKEDWSASAILSSVNIKESICSYSYSPRMRQLLFSPTMYGKINLSIQSNFTSNYGLALYENCVRYRNLRRTKVFSLDMFRKLMGVSSEKYLIFRDFKKRIINKAVEEINTLSDLVITPNINKVGQKIISIYFDISEKNDCRYLKLPINSFIEKDRSHDEISSQASFVNDCMVGVVKNLKGIYSLNDATIEAIIKSYGIDKIKNKMDQIESTSNFATGKIYNLAGFLLDTLKKDYTPCKSNNIVFQEKKTNKEKEIHEMKKRQKKDEEIKNKYAEYSDTKLCEFIDNLSKEKLEKIKLQFEKNLIDKKDTLTINRLKIDGFSSKIVRIFFRNFLNEHYPEFISNIITFHDFQNIINKR